MAPVLGYWDIRGLVEPVRMLLYHAGIEFEDKRYSYGESPTYDRKEWLDTKYQLDLDFPNLPYYIDDEVKLTQSLTIVRYLAKKHGLYPEGLQESLAAETIEQFSRDFCISMKTFSYTTVPMSTSAKGLFEDQMYENLTQVSKYLGEKKWFVADKLSYADFMMHESIDQMSYLLTDTYAKFPNLAAHAKRIEALPGVQKYMKGDKYKVWPLLSPFATWGGKGEAPERST